MVNHIAKVLLCCAALLLAQMGCPQPPINPPSRNQCSPTSNPSNHPDWKIFQEYIQQTPVGGNACLQLVWHDQTGARNSDAILVRINEKGELSSATRVGQTPFQELQLPDNPERYTYRFRVFVLASSQLDSARLCSQSMKSPDYTCLLSKQSNECLFYYEFRPLSPLFTGQTMAINDDPTLACRAFFRDPTEPPPLEMPQEQSPEIGAESTDTSTPSELPIEAIDAGAEPLPEAMPDQQTTPDRQVTPDQKATPETQEPPGEALQESPPDDRPCQKGETRPCYTGPLHTRGVGLCLDGVQTCIATAIWANCEKETLPAAEVCNNKDDNCDGLIDTPLLPKECNQPQGPGSCKKGLAACSQGKEICVGRNPQALEICENNIDDDCDGTVDQSPFCNWANIGGGSDDDRLHSTAIAPNGDVLLAGHTFSSTLTFGSLTALQRLGQIDSFVAKLDSNGKWLWATNIGAPNSEVLLQDITVDANNHSYVTGFYIGNLILGNLTLPKTLVDQMFVAKLDSNGKWLWAITPQNATGSWAGTIVADTKGRLFVVGDSTQNIAFTSTISTTLTNDHTFVVAIDSTQGKWLWTQPIPTQRTAANRNNITRALALTPQDDVLVGGFFLGQMTLTPTIKLTSNGGSDAFIAKLNTTTQQWVWALSGGGSSQDSTRSIKINSKGSIVAAVSGSGNQIVTYGKWTISSSSPIAAIARIASNGQWQWVQKLNDLNFYTAIKEVAIDDRDQIYAIGDFSSTFSFNGKSFSEGNGPFYALSFDGQNQPLWCITGSGGKGIRRNGQPFHTINATPDGNVFISGSTQTTQFGNSSFSRLQGGLFVFVAKNPHR